MPLTVTIANASEDEAARVVRTKLERVSDQHVDEDDDAKTQDEERELLDLHRVFARRGFGRHDGDSFAHIAWVGNGSGVGGTRVMYLKSSGRGRDALATGRRGRRRYLFFFNTRYAAVRAPMQAAALIRFTLG